jgi:hypothetical protein
MCISSIGKHKGGAQLKLCDIDSDQNEYLCENIHNDFCKYTLGLNKHSSSEACRGELGRYPLCNKIWAQMIKYWLRMENGTTNLILRGKVPPQQKWYG